MSERDKMEGTENVGVVKISDFLDFLNISFQVTDAISNHKSNNRNISFSQLDFEQLQQNELISSVLARANANRAAVVSPTNNNPGGEPNGMASKSKSVHSEDEKSSHSEKKSKKKSMNKSRSHKSGCVDTGLDPALQQKLDEVINEGILDSVLPFVCPSVGSNTECTGHHAVVTHANNRRQHTLKPTIISTQPEPEPTPSSTKKLNNTPERQGVIIPHTTMPLSKAMRKKTSGSGSMVTMEKHSEPEVIIRVCDELKGVSRDFSCPQKLLVSKMGYFADVTSGQRLEDMDISVHCDLQIFEWLMKWVKKDANPNEDCPCLDASNVVPILVSASFLQMEPLLLDCLSYCHGRLNEVIKASANLSCLNDNIITRLAAMFTNIELESVKDKKDRIAPRLWTKMIQSLCEVEPQSLRGHYASVAGLFRCLRCGKYLTQSIAPYVYCVPQNMKLNRWGQLISTHVRDTNWNLNNFVSALHKELKSWRKVYWRLWGQCHFLYCAVCETYFPAYQMLWCQYHPDQPQFMTPATGRYPCCGAQANRYETLSGPSGCQFRDHTVQPETDRDRAVLQLCMVAADGGNLYESPPIKPYAYNQGENWWTGIALIPKGVRQGLLPNFHVEDLTARQLRKFLPRQASTLCLESSSDTESSDGDKSYSNFSPTDDSSDGEESEDYSSSSNNWRRKQKTGRHTTKTVHGRVAWSGENSARSNQDNQREFEERAMKQVIALVGKKTGSDTNVALQTYQQGGIYVKLEAEWREGLRQKNNANRSKLTSAK